MQARFSRESLSLYHSLALKAVNAQTAGGEWPTYGGDLGHTRYAPFDQIDATNFAALEIAWRFSVANMGPTPETRFQSTPLVIDGVLYTTVGRAEPSRPSMLPPASNSGSMR